MKLRMKGDSIRFRLTRSEVSRLASGGCVQEAVRFGPGPGQRLRYGLSCGEEGSIQARFLENEIEVVVPTALAKSWASSERIGLEAVQAAGPDSRLRILIEKDLACLSPREDEDESDAFPNPKTSC